MCLLLLFMRHGDHRDLHSFPTRRSSDLVEFVIPFGLGGGSDLMARIVHKIIVEEKLVPVSIALVNKPGGGGAAGIGRSEEHTSELQSQSNLVCRLLLEKKKDERVENLRR